MTQVDITLPESEARRFLNEMKEDVEEMENALECLRKHDLAETDAYLDLQAKKSDKEMGVKKISEQIDEQTHEEGLAELFG
jgi:hypothetical protein